MKYYAYQIMMRKNVENHILKCRQLFNQYLVDMWAKIESERLLYLRLNQKKLRAEQYIHLKDAIYNDKNTKNMGQLVILPSTHAGSPRQMHEHAQDGLTYARKYGCADLFITFTCNPNWHEIKKLLIPGQSPSDRHDITARVFKQKLLSLIKLITKYKIYGKVRCWMYSIEWQKRGLPHAHILIWLEDKIMPNQIDNIVSAEIPNPEIDPKLFNVVCKHMIHGPCGSLNGYSPCMKDGICTRKYPKELVTETQTGINGYPQYRRRSQENGGQTANIYLKGEEIEIDNRWVIPYCPLLTKIYEAHINVEICTSIKSIKYLCKYILKGITII